VARPCLRNNPKFKRLKFALNLPAPYVLGLLEFVWAVGYETGNPIVGDALDVELAAEWTGPKGTLCAALVECGFLDKRTDGKLEIHDFWHHAPDYVMKRAKKEAARKNRYAPRVRQCTAPWRTQHSTESGRITPPNSELSCVSLPNSELGSPPAPMEEIPPIPPRGETCARVKPRGAKCSRQRSPEHPLFVRFWTAYPRKVARPAAVRAWQKLATEMDGPRGEALVSSILAGIERYKRTEQWQRDEGRFIPHPATWLNQRRWEDDLSTPATQPTSLPAERAEQARARMDELTQLKAAPSPDVVAKLGKLAQSARKVQPDDTQADASSDQ
jgi:hypothetical protein